LEKEHWDSSTEKARTLKIEDFGILEEVKEMAKMPLIANSFMEVQKVLESLINKQITNKSGISAIIS